ncbi:sigma-70 family RNA polymerase sigma factor [Robertmurraya massiliosenegalensis]|uniref:sigma-70 family RNA polymerase sigma factor n=1 Tax=Robertmurraya TaxID=2837507 RepID=UPI0039A4937E
MTTNEQLVKKAISGNDEAFLELIKIHKIDLYKTALSYLRNEGEALEAVQEVTYRAYKSMRKIKEPAYFKTWLIRIMINYCHDQLRKKKREVLNEEYLMAQGVTDSHDSLEVEDVLQSLDTRSRELITLKYLNGLKIKEIASEMDCPEGTIKTWLHKALQSMRTKFSEKGEN